MFDDSESSIDDGSPVELYRFVLGDEVWTYTSADEAVVYLGETYDALEMERSDPEQSQEQGRAGITIRVARDSAIVAKFVKVAPPQAVGVSIMVVHRTDGDAEVKDFWKGKIRSVEWAGHLASMRCESNESQLQRWGLRELHQVQCNATLYSVRCGVPKSAFKIVVPSADISISADGLTLTATIFDAFDDGWFTGGYGERPDNLLDARFIASHTGASITLQNAFEGVEAFETFNFYAGCDHSFAACTSEKFAEFTDDGEAFVACPTIPSRNPHDSSIT